MLTRPDREEGAARHLEGPSLQERGVAPRTTAPADPPPRGQDAPVVAAAELVNPAGAAVAACRCAVDLWSQDGLDPVGRAAALGGSPLSPEAATSGRSGVDRHRVELVLPGDQQRADDGTVLVEVTALVVSDGAACPRPARSERAADGSQEAAAGDTTVAVELRTWVTAWFSVRRGAGGKLHAVRTDSPAAGA